MILSEPAPPPIVAESYGVAPEHAFTPACIAVQEFFQKQEVMPLDRVHMFAGHLVMMEITIAQLRSKAARIPTLRPLYLQQIVKEELNITDQSMQLDLNENEKSDAVEIAVAVLGGIQKNPTDTNTPLAQLEHGAQRSIPEFVQKELVFA